MSHSLKLYELLIGPDINIILACEMAEMWTDGEWVDVLRLILHELKKYTSDINDFWWVDNVYSICPLLCIGLFDRLNPEDNRASIVAKIKEGLLYEMRRPPF
jgi:hypothetical protein